MSSRTVTYSVVFSTWILQGYFYYWNELLLCVECGMRGNENKCANPPPDMLYENLAIKKI